MWKNSNKKTVFVSLTMVLILSVMSISACSDGVKEKKVVTIPSQKIKYSVDNVSFDLTVPEYTGDVFKYYKGTATTPKEDGYILDIGDGWEYSVFELYNNPSEEHVSEEVYPSSAEYYKAVIPSWETVQIDDTDPEFFNLLSSKIGKVEYYPIVRSLVYPKTWRCLDLFENRDQIRVYYVSRKIDSLPVFSGTRHSSAVRYNAEYASTIVGSSIAISLLKDNTLFDVDSHSYTADSEIGHVDLSEVADISDHLDEVAAYLKDDNRYLSGDYRFFNAEIAYCPISVNIHDETYFPGTYEVFLIPVWSLDYVFFAADDNLNSSGIYESIYLDIRTGEVISCRLP